MSHALRSAGYTANFCVIVAGLALAPCAYDLIRAAFTESSSDDHPIVAWCVSVVAVCGMGCFEQQCLRPWIRMQPHKPGLAGNGMCMAHDRRIDRNDIIAGVDLAMVGGHDKGDSRVQLFSNVANEAVNECVFGIECRAVTPFMANPVKTVVVGVDEPFAVCDGGTDLMHKRRHRAVPPELGAG